VIDYGGFPLTGMRAYLYPRSAEHLHRGVDLAAAEGAPVYAALAGSVEIVTSQYTQGFSGYGKVIVLTGTDGHRQLYAHLSQTFVVPGQWVEQGDPIALAGRTAYSKDNAHALTSGAHLHYEVSPGAYPRPSEAARVDPVLYLASRGGRHPITLELVQMPEVERYASVRSMLARDAPSSPSSPSSSPTREPARASDGSIGAILLGLGIAIAIASAIALKR
jgi:hypothetical protein